MSIELITGYAGEGHVSAADIGRFQQGVCGKGRYVLDTGTCFQATVQSGNKIRIGSGDAVDQGRHISIPNNSYEEVTLENGTVGQHRYDLICLQYAKNSSTAIESASVVVKKGTAVAIGTEAAKPSPTQDSIDDGTTLDQMPLYYVHISGTSIDESGVIKAFEIIPSLSSVVDKIYPIGSVYMSLADTDPGTLFGGEWTKLSGRFLLSSSPDKAAGSTGGSGSVTLTQAQMPAHTHTGPAHTHTVNNHRHSIPAHGHNAVCENAGNHNHEVGRGKYAGTGTARYAAQSGDSGYATSKNGLHAHTVSVMPYGPDNTGHTSIGTNEAGTGNTGSAGSGQPVSIMPPYLVVNMWYRTS